MGLLRIPDLAAPGGGSKILAPQAACPRSDAHSAHRRGRIRAAWRAARVTMLLVSGAGLHYLVLGLPGLGYNRHIELVPVGWRDLSHRVLEIAAEVRKETGVDPVIVGRDRYATASELAFYGTEPKKTGVPKSRGR